MKTVCICGAGTMGSGIAQVTAMAGYETILFDVNETVLGKAEAALQKNLDNLLSKGKIEPSVKDATLQRLRFTSSIAACKADLVIEAIVEKMEIKTSLFNDLLVHNGPQTIFATNTSSLSVSELASSFQNAERFAGLHFFNPAPLMKLVEVVKGTHTSDAVTAELVQFTRSLGKEPVVCRDAPGFIVNRVARPYYITALRMAEEGSISFETIDTLLESRGFRMGPFRLMDLIGNDVNYAVSCSVWEQLGRPERLRPSPIQQQKVESGELGKKTGKGYYEYPSPAKS